MKKVLFKVPVFWRVLFLLVIIAVCGCSKEEEPIYGNEVIEWRSSIEPVTNYLKLPIRHVPAQEGEYKFEATNVSLVSLSFAKEFKSFGSDYENSGIYEPEESEKQNIVTPFADIRVDGRIVYVRIKANETEADRYLLVVAEEKPSCYGAIWIMQEGGK